MKKQLEQTRGSSRRSNAMQANKAVSPYGMIPPQAVDIEKAVLGAILLEKERLEEVLEIIHSSECFYNPHHAMIFNAIKHLSLSGSIVDLLTVTEELRKSDDLELVGGGYYLTQLTMSVVSSAHVVAHSRIIMEKYILREIIRTCTEATSGAYSGKEDPFDLLEILEKSLYELASQNAGAELQAISGDIVDVFDDIEHKRKHQVTFSGVPTGFPDLDKLTGGWQPTDLIILAARPSVGKTAFALNLAFNAATSKIKRTAVAVFSLEMARNQLVKRLISLSSGVELKKIKNPTTLEVKDIQGMHEFVNPLGSAPIFIDDTPGITAAQIKGKCRRLFKKLSKRTDIDEYLIIIDYLQLMGAGAFYKGNREQEISSISRDLKILAKELNVSVLALSQLSRAVEGRKDNKPVLSDLRESGAIEQDADLVGLMYRPTKEEISKMPALANANYLDIAKHRNGELDAMPLYKDLSIQKFSDHPLVAMYDFGDLHTPGKLRSGSVMLEDTLPQISPDDLPF